MFWRFGGSKKNELSQREGEKIDERFLATWPDRLSVPPDTGEDKVKIWLKVMAVCSALVVFSCLDSVTN